MILQVIASVFLIIAIAAFFGLTPERITDDMMSLMTPNDTMKDKARNIRGNKKRHGLYRVLVNIKGALASTGKSKQFTIVICASVVLFAAGVIVSILINNLFLMPVLAVTFALLPFFYITNTLSYYEKQTKEELETALSIITTSYERCDDVVQAVKENIQYAPNAGPELKHELEITVADMKSGNYEGAITRLESRVGSSMMSDVCRGLIGILRGDDNRMYWATLALKFNDTARQQLRLQAQKVPRKVKRLSMCLLICFMLIYVVVILEQIMSSIGVLFG